MFLHLPLLMFPHLTSCTILGFLIQPLIRGNSIIIKMAFRANMKFTVFLCYKNTVAFFALLVATLYIFGGLRETTSYVQQFIIFFNKAFKLSEKVNIRERPNQAKLLSVLMVIVDGIVVSQIDGPITTIAHSCTSHADSLKYTKNWVKGPVLVGATVVLSVCYNLQMQHTTNEYPDFPLIWIMLSALTAWLQSLVIKMRGAFFLSFLFVLCFNIVGGCVIVIALLVFQWAKWRQTHSDLPQ
ncbi:WAT1-related protein [Pyrus ussuriensis x Pyrus communis]|uniref:WAT1-related protein n=1 Tax=Pyrus ussuriensis x Pyrus communis TaxID=2448454 RepID=A0A5N5GUX6_9ROSA|nr:WAT1-related protein [Pyrus ussuriensis x Pyrus communis]